MNALITDYPGLRAAIKARRMALGLSLLQLDELAGVQSGYSAKVECGMKNLGDMSMASILGALGIGIELSATKLADHTLNSVYYRSKLNKVRAALGAKGGRKAANAMTPEQRRERARKAGKASGLSRQKRARLAKVASRERERQSKREAE